MHICLYNTFSSIKYQFLLYCPCLCCQSFLLLQWSFYVEANLWMFFLLFVYIYVLSFCLLTVVGEAIIQRSWDPINMFNPDTFLCLSQYRTWITNATSCFFVFNCLRWEVVVCIVDIGGIVDPHWLNFLFISYLCVFWSLKPRKVDVTQ